MRRITQTDWLRFHGFSSSPFESLQAEGEFALHADVMIRSFVEPVGFDRVLGSMDSSENTLLFAEPGMGKSTCRLIADYYYCHSELFRKNKECVLSVPHTALTQVLALAYAQAKDTRSVNEAQIDQQKNRSGKKTKEKQPAGENTQTKEEEGIPQVHLSHHLYEIMSRIMVAFADLVRTETEMRSMIAELSQDEKSFILQLISPFSVYLDFSQISIFRSLGIRLAQATNTGSYPDASIARRIITEEDLFWILQSLEIFVRWIRGLGISKTYVMVDGVNAIESAATNCLLAMDILRPLLANLSMLNQAHGIVFKLFLPVELKSFIILDHDISLGVNVALLDLTWHEEGLRRILRERLAAYKRDLDRDRTETSFDLFCATDLRGRIEDDLIRVAAGNPRRLLNVCTAMLDAHCSKKHTQDHLYWLTSEDWKAASKHHHLLSNTDGKFNNIPITREQIAELTNTGENSGLEFKSSARWDMMLKKTNKTLVTVIAKTITGMLNSNGGILLIGVQDDGQILGIEQDLSTVTPATLDSYERFLIDSVKNHIGLEYMGFVKVSFVEVQGKMICVVRINRATEPVFMLPSHSDEFWVRTGNSTRSLTPRSAHIYITQHWKT